MADRITGLHWTPASGELETTGLLGWARFTLDGWIEFDSVAVRRSPGGRVYLSYPSRKSHTGRLHTAVRFLNESDRGYIERVVLSDLGFAPARRSK